MRDPCPASISGTCLNLREGFGACPDDDCDREADSPAHTPRPLTAEEVARFKAWYQDNDIEVIEYVSRLVATVEQLQAEVARLTAALAATGRPPNEALVFGFVGSFDALAASFGWYDHSRYRWFVYPADEAAVLDAIREKNPPVDG